MTSTLLTRHPVLATRDVDRARTEVAQRFCPHVLEPTRRGARLDMVHNAASIGEVVTLNYLRYGDEVRITPGTFEDFFLLQVPLAGSARVRVGERVVASDRHHASLGSPTEPVDMIWSETCEQLLVYVDRRAVEELAAVQPDESPTTVVFDPHVDLDAAPVRAWMRMVHLALDDLEAGGALFRSPLAAGHFEQALVSGLLSAQPNTSSTSEPDPVVGSRAVHAVVELIEADPGRAWRLADLARHAGVAPRTLQESFRRERGVTPLEQLRRTRLACARKDLVEADPGTTSVTDVAARWGFFHLGRFSQAYRSAYQELPSQTLGGHGPLTRRSVHRHADPTR